MRKEIENYNPTKVMDYVRENYETNNFIRYIGKMYVEDDIMYIVIKEQTKDNYILDWKEVSFKIDNPKLQLIVYGEDFIINKIEALESKLKDATDYLSNVDYSRSEALEMCKESFIDWCMMWEKIGSNDLVVITQDMIKEWEEEWEEENK